MTTQQATRKRTSTKTRKAAPPATHKLQTLVKTAQATGRAVRKTGSRVADPLVQSIQKEEPKTLAKMALAALAPQLAQAALRFAIRNPVMAVAGLVIVAAIANYGAEADAAA